MRCTLDQGFNSTNPKRSESSNWQTITQPPDFGFDLRSEAQFNLSWKKQLQKITPAEDHDTLSQNQENFKR